MTSQDRSDLWVGDWPLLRGPWFGAGGPGSEPIELCAEVFTDANRVSGITFNPEGSEAFFSLNTPDGMSADLMWTRMVDGVWVRPEQAAFNSDQIDNDIVMSPDGQRLVWRSWRALPGNSEPEKNVCLWAADRCGEGWGDPLPVECGGERQAAVYPGITTDGTLYFSARTAVVDGEPTYAILRAHRQGLQYEEPEIVIPDLTSAADLCVAPDGSFLVATIFRQPRFKGAADLRVSLQRSDGTWTPLRELGSGVRTERTEFCPTISADGSKLLFCRIDREDRSVPASTWWIGTAFISDLYDGV